jgi:hypothetical protein
MYRPYAVHSCTSKLTPLHKIDSVLVTRMLTQPPQERLSGPLTTHFCQLNFFLCALHG